MVTSVRTWFRMLAFTEVTKANEFGTASTWLTGKLPALDGVEILVSSKMRDDMAATGVVTGSGALSGLCTVHARSWKVGVRRDVLLEFEKNITTQQYSFVTTMRLDVQCMPPATVKPVGYAYDIA